MRNVIENTLLFLIGAKAMRYLYVGCVLVKEKYSIFDPLWFVEFRDYYEGGRNKMTIHEFHTLYTLYRLETYGAWEQNPRETEAEIRGYYNEDKTKFHLFRHIYRHRISSFYEILKHCPKNGCICEYGCGTAPVTHFLISRKPDIKATLVDIESHTFRFAKYRFKNNPNVKFESPDFGDKYPLQKSYDIIICDDVLEHVPNPLELCKHFYNHLKPNGKLFVNFIFAPDNENLISSAKLRNETINFLNTNLRPIRPLRKEDQSGQDAIYVKG